MDLFHIYTILFAFLCWTIPQTESVLYNVASTNLTSATINGLPSVYKCPLSKWYILTNKTNNTPFPTGITFSNATYLQSVANIIGCCDPGYTGCLIYSNTEVGGCCPAGTVCCRNNNLQFVGCPTVCPYDTTNYN